MEFAPPTPGVTDAGRRRCWPRWRGRWAARSRWSPGARSPTSTGSLPRGAAGSGLARHDAARRRRHHPLSRGARPRRPRRSRASPRALARRHRGLLFEDKGVAYALHYRGAPGSHRSRIERCAATRRAQGACRGSPAGKGHPRAAPARARQGNRDCRLHARAPVRKPSAGVRRGRCHRRAGIRRGGNARRTWREGGTGNHPRGFRLSGVAAVRDWLARSVAAVERQRGSRHDARPGARPVWQRPHRHSHR